MPNLLFVFGTRPEAIKLCPVIACIRESAPHHKVSVCVTAQHRDMLDQVLKVFDILPDYDLNVMAPGQSLFDATARIISGLEPVLRSGFDLVVVQGDTATTFVSALAAFYARIPVAHVEAGLRTGNFNHPFPEEMNRVLTTRLAALHFAATDDAASNLAREGISRESIHVTGNPVIDALERTSAGLRTGRLIPPATPWRDPAKRLILVTAHRRENFGEPLNAICRALSRLAARTDIQIAYPVHPNPNVRSVVDRLLRDCPNIFLLEPLDYVSFVDFMRHSDLLLTDSGGIQEEGPSLGKPVLVMRETTERPEAVAAGAALLVGTGEDRIFTEVCRLLDDRKLYQAMAQVVNPYGEGHASERILAAIDDWFITRQSLRSIHSGATGIEFE